MEPRSTVPWIAVMVGMTIVVLADPLIAANWKLIPLAVLVAGVGGYAISSGINWISAASPRGAATMAAVVQAAECIAIQVAMVSKGASGVQSLVMAFGPFILFRLVVTSMDLFIDEFTMPLLAGLIGAAVFACAVPLIAAGHPGLAIWTCVGIGGVLGFAEGLVSGALLWRMIPESRR
ncbi:hypothetical protein ACIA58_33955 [Kribbella sp. NPDC051586]|uniref:hypothetical protein n=1 Tax=Kribbella sp. NPDC051586 TaxID=3364118 RepID=UPI0037BA8ADC